MLLWITHEIQIEDSELEYSFSRSSGPGGQNVNKVNSKAHLRWNLTASRSLKEDIRARLRMRLGAHLNGEGVLILSSDRYRDQLRNREDCLQKFLSLVKQASLSPKVRKKVKVTRSSKEKRKTDKRQHAEKKTHRKKPTRRNFLEKTSRRNDWD